MAEKKEQAKAAPAPKAEASPPETASGNKKINRMTLAEIEAKLNEIRGTQGGSTSRYAKHLLQRKKALGS